jgi:hypothetical protein
VIEPPGIWEDHVAPAFRNRVPQLVEREGSDWLALEGTPFFSYAMMGGLARQDPTLPTAGAQGPVHWREALLPGAYRVADRLKDMDRDGIDAAVVYPTVAMGLFGLADQVLAGELARGYNRWLAEFVRRPRSSEGRGRGRSR